MVYWCKVFGGVLIQYSSFFRLCTISIDISLVLDFLAVSDGAGSAGLLRTRLL